MFRLGICAIGALGMLVASTACSSDNSTEASAPCDVFRRTDAIAVLGVDDVAEVSFKEIIEEELAASGTTTVDKAVNLDAVSQSLCGRGHRTSDTATAPAVAYQYGFAKRSSFPDAKTFLDANLNEGDTEVDGVGEAALYSLKAGSPGRSAITVLLSGGRNFTIETNNLVASSDTLVQAAQGVIDRL